MCINTHTHGSGQIYIHNCKFPSVPQLQKSEGQAKKLETKFTLHWQTVRTSQR